MAKWNKKLGLVFVNFGLLTMAPNFANADNCYDPCNESCGFGGMDFGVDFLYWKPFVEHPDYAVLRHKDQHGEGNQDVCSSKWGYKCLCLDWQPGFRLRAGKDDVWCNWRLDGSYTWLQVNSSGRCTRADDNEFVASPLFHPSFDDCFCDPRFEDLTTVRGHFDLTYQTWDVIFSYDIACNRCHKFAPFFGVEGLIYNQKYCVGGFADPENRNADSVRSKWSSDFFGVGLKWGTAYEFQLIDCLKFYSNASGTITVGEHDGKFRCSSNDPSGNVQKRSFSDGDCTRFVPGYKLAVGFLYESEMCGYDFVVRAGWEFNQWFNLSAPRKFFSKEDGGEHCSASQHHNPGFHGLVAGLDLQF